MIKNIKNKFLKLNMKVKIGIPIFLLFIPLVGMKLFKSYTVAKSVESKKNMLFSVKNIKLEKRDIFVKINGYVKPFKIINISPSTYCKISKIYVKNGQFLRKGDSILDLDKEDLFESLKAAAKKAENSETKYEAGKLLQKKGYITETDLKDLAANFHESKKAVMILEQNIESSFVKAPFDGYITNLLYSEGEYVNPTGKPLVGFMDFKKVLIESYTSTENVKTIKPGDYCYILLKGKKYHAKIYDINKMLNDITKTASFRMILDDNQENNEEDSVLMNGESVDAFIDIGSYDTNKLNASWISLNEEGNLCVKTIKDGLVDSVNIEIIDDDTENIFIKSIGENISIITAGHEFVKKGNRIKPDDIKFTS